MIVHFVASLKQFFFCWRPDHGKAFEQRERNSLVSLRKMMSSSQRLTYYYIWTKKQMKCLRKTKQRRHEKNERIFGVFLFFETNNNYSSKHTIGSPLRRITNKKKENYDMIGIRIKMTPSIEHHVAGHQQL